jgi:F-type H+-transporting ATPase subunit gamma
MAVHALADYDRTVILGLQALLRTRGQTRPRQDARRAQPRVAAVFFGSDQGMCGQLNEEVHSFGEKKLTEMESSNSPSIIVVGERIAGQLEDAGRPPQELFSVPGSVDGIGSTVRELVLRIEAWQREQGIDTVLLFYAKMKSQASHEPVSLQLLPFDETSYRERENLWPRKSLPQFTMDRGELLSALVRQYLFVSLFRAQAESLASENASRLAAMQGAEKNIKERLDQLRQAYNQERQMSITSELLDIVTGFEALREDEEDQSRR